MKEGRPRIYRLPATMGLLLAAASLSGLGPVQETDAQAGDAPPEAATPKTYVVDYPPANQFCPPVRTFFYEVVRTFEVVRGRRFTHQPNGGYGLPIVRQVGGKHLLHLGADVGWHRVGEPVYAVAAGVVRVSEGPSFTSARRKPGGGGRAGARTTERQPGTLHWGNCIIIEHRLPSGDYFTTIYGHLGSNRLVKAGDIVEAGQQIGTIGRKHFRINGGYDPHVHFAVRQGRLAEPGCTLLHVWMGGKFGPIRLLEVGPEEIEIQMPGQIAVAVIVHGGRQYQVTAREGRFFAPAAILWDLRSRPGFEILGYGLTTDGWYDPVAFLREHGADLNPAPLRGPRTPRARK